MAIGEMEPPRNLNPIKWLTDKCLPTGMTWGEIKYDWYNASRQIEPYLKNFNIQKAQRRLVKLISHRHRGATLPVVAKLINDLHDENRGNIEIPYDVEVLRHLGLLESVYGSVHFPKNQKSLLDAAAGSDLYALEKRRCYIRWTGDYSYYELEYIIERQKELRRFRRNIKFGPPKAPPVVLDGF